MHTPWSLTEVQGAYAHALWPDLVASTLCLRRRSGSCTVMQVMTKELC